MQREMQCSFQGGTKMDWLHFGGWEWNTLAESLTAHVLALTATLDVHTERHRFPDLMTPPQSFALFALVAWRLLTRVRKPSP
jgi:hypothetical protein